MQIRLNGKITEVTGTFLSYGAIEKLTKTKDPIVRYTERSDGKGTSGGTVKEGEILNLSYDMNIVTKNKVKDKK